MREHGESFDGRVEGYSVSDVGKGEKHLEIRIRSGIIGTPRIFSFEGNINIDKLVLALGGGDEKKRAEEKKRADGANKRYVLRGSPDGGMTYTVEVLQEETRRVKEIPFLGRIPLLREIPIGSNYTKVDKIPWAYWMINRVGAAA